MLTLPQPCLRGIKRKDLLLSVDSFTRNNCWICVSCEKSIFPSVLLSTNPIFYHEYCRHINDWVYCAKYWELNVKIHVNTDDWWSSHFCWSKVFYLPVLSVIYIERYCSPEHGHVLKNMILLPSLITTTSIHLPGILHPMSVVLNLFLMMYPL